MGFLCVYLHFSFLPCLFVCLFVVIAVCYMLPLQFPIFVMRKYMCETLVDNTTVSCCVGYRNEIRVKIRKKTSAFRFQLQRQWQRTVKCSIPRNLLIDSRESMWHKLTFFFAFTLSLVRPNMTFLSLHFAFFPNFDAFFSIQFQWRHWMHQTLNNP